MSSVHKAFVNSLQRNLGLKIASLVIAVILWVYVQSSAPPPRFIKFMLQYSYDDSQWFISGRKPISVNVTAQGQPEDLRRVENWRGEFVATVDLSNAQAGVGRYPVRLERDTARDYNVHYVNPDPITLTIEKVITSPPKKVLVQSQDVPDGYTDKEEVNPETVTVTGPESDVNKVTQVTAEISLLDFKPGNAISVPVPVVLRDSKNDIVGDVTADPSKVNVHTHLVAAQNLKNVPIDLNWSGSLGEYELDGSPKIIPPQVALSGDPSALKDIQMVEAEPINLTGLTGDVVKKVRLKGLPRGVTTHSKTVRVMLRLIRKPALAAPPIAPTTIPQVSSPSAPAH